MGTYGYAAPEYVMTGQFIIDIFFWVDLFLDFILVVSYAFTSLILLETTDG